MKYNQYRFKFYFNASHAIYLLGELGQSHPHTWEIIVQTVKITDNFVLFNEIEKAIEDFLTRYQDVSINTVEPFTTTNPTLENICTYFKECTQEMLYAKGWLLLSIELSETPTRSYLISESNELDANDAFYKSQSEETLQEILDKLTKEKLDALRNINETLLQEAPPDDHEQNTLKLQKAPEDKHIICSTIFSRPNTLEIKVDTVKNKESIVQFNEVENTIKDFLSYYQDVSINTIRPFTNTNTNTTLENLCFYFKECIQEILHEKGWLLLSIELCETPTRSHLINVSSELAIDEDVYNPQRETLEEVYPDNHEQSAMESQEAQDNRKSLFRTIFRWNKRKR